MHRINRMAIDDAINGAINGINGTINGTLPFISQDDEVDQSTIESGEVPRWCCKLLLGGCKVKNLFLTCSIVLINWHINLAVYENILSDSFLVQQQDRGANFYAHCYLGCISWNGKLPQIIFFAELHCCKNFEIEECEQYKGSLDVCSNFLAKFFSVRSQYHSAHFQLGRMGITGRDNSLQKLIFFIKLQWCKFFETEECEQYKSYLDTSANVMAKFFSVRPQYRGAHFHLGRMGLTCRDNSLPKIIFLIKLQWCKCFEKEECEHYKGYLDTSANFLAKSFSVRPQYRGAHSHLGNMSRDISLTKIFFLRKCTLV